MEFIKKWSNKGLGLKYNLLWAAMIVLNIWAAILSVFNGQYVLAAFNLFIIFIVVHSYYDLLRSRHRFDEIVELLTNIERISDEILKEAVDQKTTAAFKKMEKEGRNHGRAN